MQDDLDSAARYIERAEEVRVIAATMEEWQTRECLLKIANDYLAMAQSRKEIHALSKAVSPR